MRIIFAIYGLGFGFLCGLICLLYLHAWRRRQWLALNAAETLATQCDVESWFIVSATGFTGMLIALLAPESWVSLGGWIYCILFVLLPLHARSEKSRLNALQTPATPLHHQPGQSPHGQGEHQHDSSANQAGP